MPSSTKTRRYTPAVHPVPVTAAVADYADYPVKYLLTSGGGHRIQAADAIEPLLTSPWVQRPEDHIIGEHIAPDGQPVITWCWPGGTWGGLCGSTRWVVDHEDTVRTPLRVLMGLGGNAEIQQHTSGHEVGHSQAWWVRGLRTREGHGWDGFRVECREKYRHEGPCRVEHWPWQWNFRAGVPL